jgi:tRNA (Thr-GGU) A37 N-methylase
MRGVTCVRHRAKFSARLRRAKFYERGATELHVASEFLNCTEKLAYFQLVIFYFKVSKNRSITVVNQLVNQG